MENLRAERRAALAWPRLQRRKRNAARGILSESAVMGASADMNDDVALEKATANVTAVRVSLSKVRHMSEFRPS